LIGSNSKSKIKSQQSIIIPFVDLSYQNNSIKQELKTAIDKVINKGRFILGAKVQEFEQKVAEYCGTKYAIGVASGTDALYLCLRGLGIGPGDEVITTPYTFFATAEAISLTSANPVFVDIDESTFNINQEEIIKFLEQRCYFSAKSKYPINRKTKASVKAIIPVHLFGQCTQMKQIIDIGNKYNLKVLEDAAQSFGSSQLINGEWKRASSFGKAGIFSFYPTKNLGALGDGGMIVTSDNKLATELRLLRIHGQCDENYHSEIGVNSRLDEIQAAVLLVKMKYLNKWNVERKKIWVIYSKRLNKLVIVPKISSNNKSVFHQYVIRTKNRNALKKYLAKNGIETKIYYPLPHHLQKCYKRLSYRKGDLPIAECCAIEALALPIYSGLSLERVEFVCETIGKFFTVK
jgi:dTDP-4-amino-4,6-dideoxygalactose transaminase